MTGDQVKSANRWDAFICYASEDREKVALPLANRLRIHGLRVWFDQWSLIIGDSLRRKIDEGLAKSRFGVVIISPDFFAKKWPQDELDGLLSRETQLGRPRILPIWHNVDQITVAKYSPMLASRIAAKTSEGFEVVAEKIMERISPNKKSIGPVRIRDENLVDIGFKRDISQQLRELTDAMAREDWTPTRKEDLIDSVLMTLKEQIDKWDIPSVRFATREIFLSLYKLADEHKLADLYSIFRDIFARAHSQRPRLLNKMIWVFYEIMMEAWIDREDLPRGEKAAWVVASLGRDFVSKDLTVTQECLTVIDNLAGDWFAPQILSKLILLTVAVFEATPQSSTVEKVWRDALDMIKIDDEYAQEESEEFTYLRDAIDYAESEQTKFGVSVAKVKSRYLYTTLEKNIEAEIERLVDHIAESPGPDSYGRFQSQAFVRVITAYQCVRPTISTQIRDRILLKDESHGIDKFNRIISESNFLKSVFGTHQMITTIDELIRFIEANADLDNNGIGFTTGSFSLIEFSRVLQAEEIELLRDVLRKYDVKDDPQIEESQLSFLMDEVVYVKSRYEMRRLIPFLQELNKIVEIKGFSADFSFQLRKLIPP